MLVHLKPRSKNIPHIPFFINLFGTGFFSGYFPFASGTFGSMVALLIFLFDCFKEWYFLIILILVFFIIGIFVSEKIENMVGHDPSIVVIDEFVGMWISLLFVTINIYTIILAFILFRFFDIIKPYPANYYNKKRGGMAIMIDDVIAGLYANIFLQIVIIFIKF